MPTILRANPKDEISIEYQRIQLTQFFLDWSLKNAEIAKKHNESALLEEIESSINSVIHSALFIESFVNQVAEEFIEGDDFKYFDRCKKEYRNKSKLSNTVWKLYYILRMQEDDCISLDNELLDKVNNVIQIRHQLLHYKPEATSRKIHRKAPNTEGMFTLDFVETPIKVEPSLIEQEINCIKAIEHYMTCRELLVFWYKLLGYEDEIMANPRYPELETPVPSDNASK